MPFLLPVSLHLGAATLLFAASACSSDSQSPPPGRDDVGLETVATGLDFPLYLTAPPGDPRLFIVEKTGRIRIVADGAVRPAPFLDLSDRVSLGGEQGLLGLAFPPDYASTGRFVVHYTDPAGDTRVSIFTVSSDPDIADAGSERVILAVDQPFPNHNGGQLEFGPDGYLYVGLGDGGSRGDPFGNGQSRATLLGKILRLDVTPGDRYAVPADNPFVGTADARGEIWSYGLRNPWRFSFDPANGDLYIGDVGQNDREEIDVSLAPAAGRGGNYGWAVLEGDHCFAASDCSREGLIAPVQVYDHGDGCSVSGGYVYRGAAIPPLQGHYFYADYCSGWVRSFRYANGRAEEPAEWPNLAPGGPVPSFGRDAAGELYVLDAGGTVSRIVPR